ncbi:MAG: 50S ribosomal protein L28 [Gemmataceae bacterium]|nr:50S ribosomal protein L28 [Gemmataceae bacterium]
MAIQCDVCGKKPGKGNKYSYRGKKKYLGGVGQKVTGKSIRFHEPNLQVLQCQVGGSVQKLRVCVKCIRGGNIQRPVKRKPFQIQAGMI